MNQTNSSTIMKKGTWLEQRSPLLLMSIVLLLVGSNLNAQNTIHVYSDEIPWQTDQVQKEEGKIYAINEAVTAASAGDVIIVHEGVYRENVVVNKDNLTIKSENGEYALVTGNEVITGWSDAADMPAGVKQADISAFNIETDYTQLFANGNRQIMARHPNNETGNMMEPMGDKSGYASLNNVSKDAGANATGHATLEGPELPNVDLTGGIFRGMTGKMRNYVYGTITGSSGNAVDFKAINNGAWKNAAAISSTYHKWSWGYVMHKNLTDYPGEWFADGNVLYYKPHEGEEINNTRIEIQVRERVLVLNNTSGVTIRGIHFMAGNVDMQNTTGATIERTSIRYLHPFWTPRGYGQNDTDPKGIYLSNSSNNTFKDVYVGHSWGNIIALRDGQNNSFENCIIEDFGWIGVFTSAIHISQSDNTNINKCTFGDAGRFQIRIDGGDALVNILDCDFYSSMKMGEDAGPIEATSTGRIGTIDMKGSVIAYNKVHDVQGIPVSEGNYKRVKATAFYMEDTENYTAHHNLIYNMKHTAYTGSHEIERVGEFLYLGPRYNAMHKPVNYYNNTIWGVDGNISIWNIHIANWEALGVQPPDTTGLIADGHFANNIFMEGPIYKLSYNSQVISSTGARDDWAASPEGSSISTVTFDAYIDHCATWGYHFNPENNLHIAPNDAGDHFTNADANDFSLVASSSVKGGGVEIQGITSSSSPDVGALEGGDRVLHAGAELTLPTFLELTILKVAVESIAIASEEITLNIGNTAQVEAGVFPSKASNQKIFWASSDANIATVSSEGEVVGVSAGAAQVIATSDDGGFMDSITVSVIYPSLLSLAHEKRLKVHPNPVKDLLSFQGNIEWVNPSIQVYDLSGSKVLETSCDNGRANIGALNGGMYLVILNNNGVEYSFKIVIQ